MSARSRAVQKVLAEARGALAFGRTHLVVIGDRDIVRQLPEMLREKLRGEIDTVTVRLAGQHDSVADCVAAAIREARREAGAGAGSSGAPAEPATRQRQALLLPDALAIPASSLRSLHEIATHLGSHRLVLFVERDGHGFDDPVAELVARLGAGVSTIEVEPPPDPIRVPTLEDLLRGPERAGAPRAPAAAAPAEPAAAAPDPQPEADAKPTGETPVRGRPPTRALPMLALTALAAGLVVFIAVPGVVETVRGELHLARDPFAAAPPEPGPAAASADPARPAIPSPPDAGLSAQAGREPSASPVAVEPPPETEGVRAAGPEVAARVAPETDPAPASKPRPGPPSKRAQEKASVAVAKLRSAPAAPPPVLVSVNFNAAPWADLVVDGRRLGPTPLANIRLRAGEHRIRARFPDGRVVERSIRVEPGRTRFQIQ